MSNHKKTSLKRNILLAGATGYLGKYILRQLLDEGYSVKAVVRNPEKLGAINDERLTVQIAKVTQPESLAGCCNGIDTVISTLGITTQKDGLTYMDVDYQANLNLLKEAQKSGVRKFMYVSVFNGEKLKNLKICEAKEKFVDSLQNSGLDYCIIRPNGFFSDMSEFFEMAQKGRIYLFGDGSYRVNPIHGADLAQICVDAIHSKEKEIECGGPDILTHNQVAEVAFSVAGNPKKIVHIPDWVRKSTLFLLRKITSSKFYGPIEFFMTVMAMDMVSPAMGNHHLEDFFKQLKMGQLSES